MNKKGIIVGIVIIVVIIGISSPYIPQTLDNENCKGTALCLTEKVTRIVDGDTIYMNGYKVRISLVDTPERDEQGFSEATEFTANLCPVGSTVVVDQDDMQRIDKYGRILGKVFCGEKLLNSELLENGHAVILTQYCSTSEFASEDWATRYGC